MRRTDGMARPGHPVVVRRLETAQTVASRSSEITP